jgi:RNA polymerase sigma-70 factor (ECF subfamily)
LKKNRQHNTDQVNNKLFLRALSPSSGVAFFEDQTKIYELDGSSGRIIEEYNEEERQIAHRSLMMESELQPVEEEFDTLEQLKEYVKAEYWREKKNAYYTLLSTEALDAPLRRQMIDILNCQAFEEKRFSLSPQTTENLESRVSEHPEIFIQFLQEMEEAQASHVCHCLIRELPDVLEQILERLINQVIRGSSDERKTALGNLALEPLFQLLVDKAQNIGNVRDLEVGINPHVYEILYRMYEQDLYRYLLRLSRNPDVAKDIASGTWIKVAESLYSLKNKSPQGFKSWLFTIARNTWLDQIRRPVEAPTEDTDLQSLIDTVRSIHDDILDRLAKEEQKTMLSDAIQALPENERTVIYLRYYQEMTFKEIAEVMGRSLRSTHYDEKRGLKSLGTKLSNPQQEGE